MGDIFKEQIIKREASGTDTLKKVGIILLFLVINIAVMLLLPTFFPFVFAALCFGVYVLFNFFNIEYEYIFTNGDLDIDCIYGKSRRKRIYSGDVKDIEIMTHVSEKGYDNDFSKAKKKKDCSSRKTGTNTYKFLVTYKNDLLHIVFEPNDALMQAMTPYLGQRRLIRKR